MAQYGGLPVEMLKNVVEESFDNYIKHKDLAIFELARTNTTFRDLCLEVMYPIASEIKVTLQPRPMVTYTKIYLGPYRYSYYYPNEPAPWCYKQWPSNVELDTRLDLHDLFHPRLSQNHSDTNLQKSEVSRITTGHGAALLGVDLSTYEAILQARIAAFDKPSFVSAQAKAARVWIHEEFCTDVHAATFDQKVLVMKARELKAVRELKLWMQEKARERQEDWESEMEAQLAMNLIVDQKIVTEEMGDEDVDDAMNGADKGDLKAQIVEAIEAVEAIRIVDDEQGSASLSSEVWHPFFI